METQLNTENNSTKTGVTQTNLFSTSSVVDKKTCNSNDDNVCPLCGKVYKNSVPFNLFHEHVIDHFTKETPSELKGLTWHN